VEKDPFLNFISDLSEKIKVSREHKQIMDRVNTPGSVADESKASLENLILTIKEKIENTVSKETVVPLSSTEVSPVTSSFVKVVSEEENNFTEFVDKLKNILTKPRTESIKTDTAPVSSIPALSADNISADTKKYVTGLDKPKETNTKTKKYVNELEKIKDNIQIEKEDSKITEIKKLIEEHAEKYIKKALVMSEYAGGGGTNAVQYVNGGTMNGDLNVNGNYLSGGVNLLDIFVTSETDSQTLSFNESNAQLSISNGNTVSLSSLNDKEFISSNFVHLSGDTMTGSLTVQGSISASGSITATDELNVGNLYYFKATDNASYFPYTVLELYSVQGATGINNPMAVYGLNGEVIFGGSQAFFGFADRDDYTNRAVDGGFYKESKVINFWSNNNNYNTVSISDNGDMYIGPNSYGTFSSDGTTSNIGSRLVVDGVITATGGNSNQWNSNYTTVSQNSAYWADIRNNVTFEKDVTIQGNLTALGTSTFQNTVFTTTTALSVVNTGQGPALYVYQAAGPSDVASFYDGDGVEVLHVGNAQGGGNPLGQVGINTSFPSAELTVNGAMSSNGVITVLGGDSNQWNSNYSSTNANSGNWGSVYTTFNTNSAKYDSVYTTSNANSANWILDDGNTKGSSISIGTNDAYHLNFETNNATRARFLSSGQLGINKLAPTKTIDLSGNFRVEYAEDIAPGVFVGGLYVRYPVTAPKDGRYNGFYGWSSTQNRYVSGTNLTTQYYITSAAGGWQLRDTSGNRLIASNANTASTLVPPRFGWINNKAWDSFDTAPTIQNTDYGVVVKETLSCNAGYFNYIGNNDNFVIERLGLKNLTLTDNEGWRGGRTTISNTLCVAPADPTNYFDQPNIFFSDAGLFHATGPRASEEYRSLLIGSNLTTVNGADIGRYSSAEASPAMTFNAGPVEYANRHGIVISNYTSVAPNFNESDSFLIVDMQGDVNDASYGTIKIGEQLDISGEGYVPITDARVQIDGNVNVNGLIRTTVAADSLYAGNSNNWNSNYTTTNSNSANWSNWSTVSASYALGSKFVKLSGDTMTGGLSTVALSTNDVYGTSSQSVFTDGSSLAGNGTGTLTLNYTNGIFTTNNVTAALFRDTLGRNSTQWNSNYTTTNTNSGKWDSVYTSFNSNSAKYDSNWTTTNTNSASWGNGGGASTTLNSNSAKWDSNWTTTNTNSGKWDSVYTSFNSNSAKYDSNYTSFNTNSAKYDSNYTSFNSNSAKYDSNYTSFNSNSAKYDSNYTSFNTNSAKYDSNYTSFNTNSAKYDSNYTSFNSNSAKYDSNYTSFNTNSAKYDSNYTSFNSNSAKYDSNYTSFNTNSAKYDSNWTTTNSSSATWYAYTQNLSTYNTTLATIDPTVLWISSLSGILPGTEISSRLSTSRGKIRGRIFMQMVNTTTNKNLYLRFANNNTFASSTNIINAGNANTQSWIRTFEGILLPGNQIIFSPYQGNVEDGLRNNPFTTYNYTPGDSIYYQVGLSIGTGSEFVAISGGYVSISPD